MSWMMVHPWMTFFLLLAIIECVSNVIANICRAIIACYGNKSGEIDSVGESED